jgi:hypothetical protein
VEDKKPDNSGDVAEELAKLRKAVEEQTRLLQEMNLPKRSALRLLHRIGFNVRSIGNDEISLPPGRW